MRDKCAEWRKVKTKSLYMLSKFSASNFQSSPMPGTNTWANTRQTHTNLSIDFVKTSYWSWTILGKFIHRRRLGSFPARSWWMRGIWNVAHLSVNCMTRQHSLCRQRNRWKSWNVTVTTRNCLSKCRKMKQDWKPGTLLCWTLFTSAFREIGTSSLLIGSKTVPRWFNETRMCWLIYWADTRLNVNAPQSSLSTRWATEAKLQAKHHVNFLTHDCLYWSRHRCRW